MSEEFPDSPGFTQPLHPDHDPPPSEVDHLAQLESVSELLEHMSKLLRRMSSGGPSTTRLRLLILVAQKPRMRKELASMLGINIATLNGHVEKTMYVNLIKENRDRTLTLNHETIQSVINFLDQNLLAVMQDTTNQQVSTTQPKETLNV